jgi:hypothetical protein
MTPDDAAAIARLTRECGPTTDHGQGGQPTAVSRTSTTIAGNSHNSDPRCDRLKGLLPSAARADLCDPRRPVVPVVASMFEIQDLLVVLVELVLPLTLIAICVLRWRGRERQL